MLVLIVSVLAGCGGGGGGGPSSAASNTPSTPPAPDPLAHLKTAEFNKNYFLGMVGAEHAYALGATGKGVTVGVLDTGLYRDHGEFDAADISPLSKDFTDNQQPDPFNDPTGHGTRVAAIIGADKDDTGMHGIAYEATILALRYKDDFGNSPWEYVTAGLRYAVQVGGADVVNMSFGADVDEQIFVDAMKEAADAGVIMVVATGNEGNDQPTFPANWASDPDMHGLLIAVGAVNSSGNIVSAFNACGDTRDFCMVAPGANIWVPTRSSDDTLIIGHGTSYSAPIVSGAAALLIHLWPNLTPQEIVQILLTTATDKGSPGVDAVYGHGLLNLEAAVKPIGQVSVPQSASAADHGALAINSRLTLGPAFGDALQNTPALANAIGVDNYNRAYPLDLNRYVRRVERYFGMDTLLAPGQNKTLRSRLGAGTSLSVSLRKEDKTGIEDADAGSRDIGSVLFSGDIGQLSSISLGYGLKAMQQFDLGPRTRAGKGLFWSASEVLSPHHGLLAKGNGVALDMAIAGDTRLNIGWFQESGGALWDTGESNLGQASLAQRFDSGATLRLGASYLTERSLFLGSDSTGAFGEESGAESLFVTLSGSLPLSDRIALIGSVTHGTTRIAQRSPALLNDWSTVRSTAFGAGVVARGVFGDKDRLGFLAGQPLRVYDASARARVPTAVREDNTVVFDTRRVTATPSGREIDFQFAYRTSVLRGVDLSSWLMMRLQPGHDAETGPGFAAGMKATLAF